MVQLSPPYMTADLSAGPFTTQTVSPRSRKPLTITHSLLTPPTKPHTTPLLAKPSQESLTFSRPGDQVKLLFVSRWQMISYPARLPIQFFFIESNQQEQQKKRSQSSKPSYIKENGDSVAWHFPSEAKKQEWQHIHKSMLRTGFLGGSDSKESACNEGDLLTTQLNFKL